MIFILFWKYSQGRLVRLLTVSQAFAAIRSYHAENLILLERHVVTSSHLLE